MSGDGELAGTVVQPLVIVSILLVASSKSVCPPVVHTEPQDAHGEQEGVLVATGVSNSCMGWSEDGKEQEVELLLLSCSQYEPEFLTLNTLCTQLHCIWCLYCCIAGNFRGREFLRIGCLSLFFAKSEHCKCGQLGFQQFMKFFSAKSYL